MIAFYKTIPNETIRKDAKKVIKQITKWFAWNPSRPTCNAETWYGEQTTIRRGHVTEDVNTAAEAASKTPPEP